MVLEARVLVQGVAKPVPGEGSAHLLEDILVTVVVDVPEPCREAPGWSGYAQPWRYVDEALLPQVPIKTACRATVGHVEIQKAIAIVIAPGHGFGPRTVRHTDRPYGTFPSRVGTMLIPVRVVSTLMAGRSDTPSGCV